MDRSLGWPAGAGITQPLGEREPGLALAEVSRTICCDPEALG